MIRAQFDENGKLDLWPRGYLRLECVVDMVREIDEKLDPSDQAFKTAVVMLAFVLLCTVDVQRVAEFTGQNVAEITTAKTRWKESGYIVDGVFCVNEDWLSDDATKQAVTFWLAVAVGDGLVRRQSE